MVKSSCIACMVDLTSIQYLLAIYLVCGCFTITFIVFSLINMESCEFSMESVAASLHAWYLHVFDYLLMTSISAEEPCILYNFVEVNICQINVPCTNVRKEEFGYEIC